MRRLVVTAITFALLALPAATSVSAATPTCAGHKATIVGNNRPNIIVGTSRRDVIVAKAGRDKIWGRGGNDIICAGKGNDRVFGGGDRDRIYGGPGKDLLKGDAGYDYIDGGPDKDACYNGAGGARKVSCEGADLKVIVRAPQSSVIGKLGPEPEFDLYWKVKNIGPKPAAGVELEIAWDEVGVTCRGGANDPSGTRQLGKLESGEFKTLIYTQDCGVPLSQPAKVELSVSATTTSAEAIKSNNSGSAEVAVVKEP